MSFFVTSIAYYPEDGPKSKYRQPYNHPRTFGHFPTLELAQAAVARNDGEMYECLYNYLVIEEIGYGIHALVEGWAEDKPLRQWWYRWEHPNWVPMKIPAWSVGVVNWSIG
jgi:hypothetical protein